MDVVSLCPLPATGFKWQSRSGAHALTVIVKATFQLHPGRAVLAPQQEPIQDADRFWDNDSTRTVFAPSDRVPFKTRADVVLVGHAFAPAKQPVRSLIARMIVGAIDKSIEVWCDRGIRRHDGQLLEGHRFVQMPLRWERAAAGPDLSNPAGVRSDAPVDAYGMIPVANLQPAWTVISQRPESIAFAPMGFGPVGAAWPERRKKLGQYGVQFPEYGWEERPLPEGLDYEYFNVAPLDQQPTEIHSEERILLENLHPDYPQLVTQLPGIVPVVVLERQNGGHEQIELHADTLWIHSDRGLCTLIFRGRIGLTHPQEAGRISVSLPGSVEEVVELSPDEVVEDPSKTMGLGGNFDIASIVAKAAAMGYQVPASPALPFAPGKHANEPSAPPPPRASDPGISTDALAALRAGRHVPRVAVGDRTYMASPPSPSSPHIAMPQPGPAPPPVVAAPAVVMANQSDSPWLSSQAPAPLAAPQTIGTAAVAAAAAMASIPLPHVDQASRGGILAASNAAAGAIATSMPLRESRPAPPPVAVVESPREMIQFLWIDEDSVGVIRRVPAWKKLLAETERKPKSRRVEVVEAAKEPWVADDKRELYEIVTRGSSMDGRGVDEALDEAIGQKGPFVAPMAMLAGDVEMLFDELETLKAALSAAAAHVGPADENLRAAVAHAKEYLQTPGLTPIPAACEALTTRIRETFVKEKKGFPADYIDTQTERALLAGRHYQKRDVFDMTALRCRIWIAGEQFPIAAYLPEVTMKKLPMYRRFNARVIGEVHPAQDPYEQAARVLRVLVLARAGNAGRNLRG